MLLVCGRLSLTVSTRIGAQILCDMPFTRRLTLTLSSVCREVFLRELISNANDAIEKLRLTSLTNKEVWDGVSPLNITIKAVKDEEGNGGRLVITGELLFYGFPSRETRLNYASCIQIRVSA